MEHRTARSCCSIKTISVRLVVQLDYAVNIYSFLFYMHTRSISLERHENKSNNWCCVFAQKFKGS
eukprot:m.166422 g.166422  ORF g.166422 m.166422 type:complete len:65 (+) comp13447_c1_seq2:3990-4184(+)